MNTQVETVRRFYDALARGDVAAVLSLLDAVVEWTEAEGFPYYSGTWRGPQAVLENLIVPLTRDWSGFSAQPREFIA
ncbi:MAG TPA: nuclear transport factor 2 family protein, partial [Micropepsaceae bacterium]|nr:nuclear transport factor 2 family protein [Micropepsaceae bacterium]